MALNASLKGAEADQGMGMLGEWPPEGEHACFVTALSISEGEFRQKDQQKFPAVSMQFKYQLCDDPSRPEPLQFVGAPFVLPKDPATLTDEGAKTRAQIEMNRLAGHLKTLLQRTPTDLAADLEGVEALLGGDKAVACVVKCQYDVARNGRTYRREFLQKLLAATSA
jgi:hypothetical protein